MAFLHCHNCDWSQDDFYNENYNPTKTLEFWNEYLFGEGKYRLDQQFTNDSEFLHIHDPITTRELIAREYEQYANHIRNMKWITFEDFKNDPNKPCPKCESDKLDID